MSRLPARTHPLALGPGSALAAALFAAALAACHRGDAVASADGGVADAEPVATQGQSAVSPPAPVDKPLLGVIAFVATIYKEPRDTSKKLGYLRVGAKVARSAEPVGKAGCPGGWYEIFPKGYVCAGPEATVDMEHPMLRAASRRPNLKTALPYHYAFVRAVLPMYLRVPSAEEQYKAEFKLKEHLDWFKDNSGEVTKVILGANDVPIDERGVPVEGKKIGELGLAKNATEVGIGALLGGEGEDDAVPFWLEGGKRAIANISDFVVPEYAAFADRARRHTGFALVGSFPTGPEALSRRFAVTTDMRLAPETKIKPDTGSPWHGVELGDELTLPLAFVRSQGARELKIVHGKLVNSGEAMYRSVHALTGKMRTLEGVKYYRTRDKHWLSQMDVGLAVAPSSWPDDANQNKKWIEISIGAQTMVLWEGKRPVYATLVSSGQAGIDDPKTTTATIRGVFKIHNKHITATMDSNESSAVGGRANTSARMDREPVESGDGSHEEARASKKSKDAKKGAAKSASKDSPGATGKGAPSASTNEKRVPRKGDGEYGVTKRRGEGTFALHDVPYIQYFASGYALHAAYWHDVFGTPRSHGCVNLSPIDAHRAFLWTDPPVPEGWHAINAGEDMGEGTAVIIHE